MYLRQRKRGEILALILTVLSYMLAIPSPYASPHCCCPQASYNPDYGRQGTLSLLGPKFTELLKILCGPSTGCRRSSNSQSQQPVQPPQVAFALVLPPCSTPYSHVPHSGISSHTPSTHATRAHSDTCPTLAYHPTHLSHNNPRNSCLTHADMWTIMCLLQTLSQ